MLGVPRERRGVITNEYLEIIHGLWTEQEVTYHGSFVQLDNVAGIRAHVTDDRQHPPVWVGGRSDAALTRAIWFGADWHPNRMMPGWLRDTGMLRLQELTKELDGRLPALCPRIQIEITETTVVTEERIIGIGTVEQVHEDFALLELLCAEHVLLDWYVQSDPATVQSDEQAWRQLAQVADQVVDLKNQAVR